VDIQLISFCLALAVGTLCFALVKYTSDEFDRWYEDPDSLRVLRVPAAIVSLIVVFAAAALVAVLH
jgi:hypothetical protein